MSARKSAEGKSKTLPRLTGIQRQVMAHVMNSIALHDYEGCCSVERIAEQLHRQPNRFMPTLKKLAENGYLQIEGTTYPVVYPTIDALLMQDPRLSEQDAKAILRRAKR
jgi:hypothetical protein